VIRLGYRPELDGLRGIAILMVVLGHTHLWPRGWVFGLGVDLFFLLSGYLITLLLLEEWRGTGRISLRGFYIRRARRLLAALAAFMVGLGIVGVVGIELGRINWSGFAITGAQCLYVTNLFSAASSLGTGNLYITHLWSLSEEEQFYLIWPLVLIGALRTQPSVRQLRFLIGGIVAFAFAFELYSTTKSQWFYGYSPLSQSTELIFGCLLAVLPRVRIPAGQWIGMALCASAVITPFPMINWERQSSSLWRLIFMVGGALLITHAGRLFTWSPLVRLGLISYSLYLWHPLFLHVLPKDRVLSHLAAVALSLMTATASYRWIEQPFRRRRTSPAPARLGPAAATA
jgi:peptidoglycan/LPS O-acetylase OafA/YrhL